MGQRACGGSQGAMTADDKLCSQPHGRVMCRKTELSRHCTRIARQRRQWEIIPHPVEEHVQRGGAA